MSASTVHMPSHIDPLPRTNAAVRTMPLYAAIRFSKVRKKLYVILSQGNRLLILLIACRVEMCAHYSSAAIEPMYPYTVCGSLEVA